MTRLPPRGEPSDIAPPSDAAALAAEVKALLETGRRDEAADRFGVLVGLWQRRASRLAFHYLGNAADTDEAVQDAFVKLYGHMTTYRADLSFDAWFSRILVNTCLDHLKARRRVPAWAAASHESAAADLVPSGEPSAERRLLAKAKWRELAAAVGKLPQRQRDVFLLTHLDQQTPHTIAHVLGMNAATVRVHLFRALRKLRTVLGDSA